MFRVERFILWLLINKDKFLHLGKINMVNLEFIILIQEMLGNMKNP